MNGFSDDYSQFDCSVSVIEDKLPQAMRIFAEMAVTFLHKGRGKGDILLPGRLLTVQRYADIVCQPDIFLFFVDMGKPGTARTLPSGDIMELDFDTGNFRRKDIFVDEWLADDVKRDT